MFVLGKEYTYMIDPEMLAAILKELGYLDEDEQQANKTDAQTIENEHEKKLKQSQIDKEENT